MFFNYRMSHRQAQGFLASCLLCSEKDGVMQVMVVSRECAECATETIFEYHTQTVLCCALAVGRNLCILGWVFFAWNNYFLQLFVALQNVTGAICEDVARQIDSEGDNFTVSSIVQTGNCTIGFCGFSLGIFFSLCG